MDGDCGLRSQAKKMKTDDYLDWDDYFMATALLAAKRSKDPYTKVGACIVNTENKIVGIGYNCMPRGNDDAFSWMNKNDGAIGLEKKKYYVCHAELNAIVNKNAADVKGCKMYVVLFPCNECAKLIIQSGIKEIIYLSDKKADKIETRASKKLFKTIGVDYRKHEPSKERIEINFNYETYETTTTTSDLETSSEHRKLKCNENRKQQYYLSY